MNDPRDNADKTKAKPQVPMFLRVICYLSFAHGGLFVLKHLTAGILGAGSSDIQAIIDRLVRTGFYRKELVTQYYEAWVANYSVHEFSNAVLYIMGLIGVYEMFRLRKRGFFMYGLAHILLTFYPVTMVYNNDFARIEVMRWGLVTAVFLIFYARNLRYMNTAPSN